MLSFHPRPPGLLRFGPGQGAAGNAARINVKVSIQGREAPTFFRAVLEGSQEIPPVATNAKATGIFVLDENGLCYRIAVNGLSGPITAAHFHNAAAGSNGGAVRAMSFDGNAATGTWTADDAQPLTPALLEDLKAGRIYVNIHTAANPGGELTLTFDPAGLAPRSGRIGETELAVTRTGPGSASLAFNGLPASERADIILAFDTGDGPANLRLDGLFYDRHLLPIAEAAVETWLGLDGDRPLEYALHPNAPNPFNPATQIRYDLPRSGRVRLTVYNALGQDVARLVDAHQSAGAYAVTWNAETMASGLYFYRLKAGGFSATRKLLLVK